MQATADNHTPAGLAAGSYDPNLDRIVRLPEVQRITGRAKTELYTDPTFPRPIKLGDGARASGWFLREVVQWLNAQLAKREAA